MMNNAAQIAAATRPLVTFVCKLLDNFFKSLHLITMRQCCHVQDVMHVTCDTNQDNEIDT